MRELSGEPLTADLTEDDVSRGDLRRAPAWRTLAEEGVDAFGGVGFEHVARHRFAGQRIRACRDPLRSARRTRACRAPPRRDSWRAMTDASACTAPSISAAGTTRLTRPQSSAVRASISSPVKQQLHRALAADVACHADGGRRAEDAGVDPGQPEFRGIRGHREIAHRHQLASGGGRCAVHAGDHRLRNPGQLQHHLRARFEQPTLPIVVDVGAHLVQVVAGAERAPGAGQHDDAHRCIPRDRVERRVQRARSSRSTTD